MQNAVILLAVGLALGTLFTGTFGSGNYQTVPANGNVMAQTNTQTGAIRLCAPEKYSFDDPRRGNGINGFYVECTDWHEKDD